MEAAAKAAGSENSFYLNLKASGVLPKDTTIVYNLGAPYKAGDKVSLYYYNETTKKMENQNQELTVDENLKVIFKVSHASIYSLLQISSEDPEPGIPIYIIVAAIVIIIALIVVVYYFMAVKSKE